MTLANARSDQPGEPLIACRDLYVRFGERWVLQHLDFDMMPGEIVTLIGPNGAGKSTLIKAMLGLTPITKGEIRRAADLRLGYMPQRFHFDHTLPLSVKRFLKLAPGVSQATIEQTLEEVGAGYLLNRGMSNLSGGEMQRVLLARALLRQPNLLVLDEPAQGVDLSGQNRLYQLIAKLRDEHGCAVLMISHDLHLVMASTDRVVCLNHHICCSGHPETVSNDPSYHALFGTLPHSQFAFYNHHHDHQHDIDGEVHEPESQG